MLKIQDWAEADRPREKLLLKGRASLSDAEILAILIGSGTISLSAVDVAKLILNGVDNDLNKLSQLTVKELQKFKGIGEAKAITIISALELGRRKRETEISKIEKITSSNDAYNLLSPHLIDLPHEEFWILLLNRANQVLRKVQISAGGVAGTVVDSKIIFKHALENLACGIILAHNHPSGNLKASHQDISLTKKLKEAGATLDITILDHLIITNNSFMSFSEEGIL
jgi:DNA repair protein RadC